MDLLLIFISGVFTALGPCILTVLPVVFSYTFGISESKIEAFIVSLFFVLGFSIVFSLLGAIFRNLQVKVRCRYPGYSFRFIDYV